MMLLLGDCLDRMAEMPDGSVDAIVTDPPYGISFMGKHWDRFDIDTRVGKRDVSKLGVRLTGGIETANRKETARTASAYANAAGAAGAYDFTSRGNRAFQEWVTLWGAECLRLLKPGGHAVVFGGTRTYHRLASGLEDAGFEIRDCLAWMFGSGFPKSLDVSKQLDKQSGHWRGRAGDLVSENAAMGGPNYERSDKGEPVTAAAAAAAAGWGTALKPAFEPIVLARKPLDGTVAGNVLAHGTGALNIDGCRIEGAVESYATPGSGMGQGLVYGDFRGQYEGGDHPQSARHNLNGRWPANVLLDEEAAAILDEQTGELTSGSAGADGHKRNQSPGNGIYGGGKGLWKEEGPAGTLFGDTGGASRFFYCAKVSRAERNAGCDWEEDYDHSGPRGHGLNGDGSPRPRPRPRPNVHPTVKPIDLMRWLTRLITPPGGTVLDPFLGSGSTGCAASLEGFQFVGIEREPDYLAIAEARVAFWQEHGEDGLGICAERDAANRVHTERAALGQLSLLA